MELDLKTLIKNLKKKKYLVFESDEKIYNLNLVGIRTLDNTPNTFNDWLIVFWKFHGQWNELRFKITTDPGTYWLKNPMSVDGTAILKEGQIRSMWRIGKHKGQYTALVQNKPATIIRDFNRDSNMDFQSGKEKTGLYGINLHRANASRESTQVHKWSAGCQVFANPEEFNLLIHLCKEAEKSWGNSFTYTLIHERDLIV